MVLHRNAASSVFRGIAAILRAGRRAPLAAAKQDCACFEAADCNRIVIFRLNRREAPYASQVLPRTDNHQARHMEAATIQARFADRPRGAFRISSRRQLVDHGSDIRQPGLSIHRTAGRCL